MLLSSFFSFTETRGTERGKFWPSVLDELNKLKSLSGSEHEMCLSFNTIKFSIFSRMHFL